MKHSEGHDRYAFPTLVMRGPGGEHTVPGWMPYDAYEAALESALPGSTSDPRPDPTVSEALDQWEMLTDMELRTLCGPASLEQLPDSSVGHFWGAGVVVLDAGTAERRSLPALRPAAVRSLADLALAFDSANRLVDALAGAGADDDRWLLRSPCDDWDLRALLNHMTGSARMVTFGVTGQAIGPDFYGDHLGPDPVAAYRQAAAEAIAAYREDPTVLERTLSLPWGEITGADLATMFAADHLVHAWDVAQTLDVQLQADGGLVERIRAFADFYVPAHRGPGMFGPEQPAPAEAAAIDQLAEFVGRRVPGRSVPRRSSDSSTA